MSPERGEWQRNGQPDTADRQPADACGTLLPFHFNNMERLWLTTQYWI